MKKVYVLLSIIKCMASTRLGGESSSRTANGINGSSSSVDWLAREMHQMRLREKVDTEDDGVSSICFFLGILLLTIKIERKKQYFGIRSRC